MSYYNIYIARNMVRVFQVHNYIYFASGFVCVHTQRACTYNCIAGNFVVQQYLVSLWLIYSWLLLALQVKVGKVASFVVKIFVLQCSTTKTTNILSHENYPLYGITTPPVCRIIIPLSRLQVCNKSRTINFFLLHGR